MDKFKIILITTSSFGQYDKELIREIESQGFNAIVNPYRRKLTETEVSKLIDEHQPVGIIAGVEPLTRCVLKHARNLRVISRAGIGMDSVDLDAAKALGIDVYNTPDAPTVPVAELTVGLMLSLLRRIHITDGGIRRKEWLRPMGNLLQGRTIGIIGCGRIGSCVAGLLAGFECKITGYDPASPGTDCIPMADMDSLLKQSDIVTLHLPYSKENYHLIDAKAIGLMKKGACLINASRGGLVDEDALIKALRSGHLAGAALDCFEEEPYSGPLSGFDNVLLTAHIGSYAVEGRVMMERQAMENLLGALGIVQR
ncbi:MAG: phosphoglycerate dehydrogenase [Dissulfuribacterales bacterium]